MGNITVRSWSSTDLVKILNGDKWLMTILFNVSTFSAELIKVLHQVAGKRKEYHAYWHDEEPVVVYATDDDMVMKFIAAEFTEAPHDVHEKITNWRKVAM